MSHSTAPAPPRVIAQSPLVVEPAAHGHALRRTLWGKLVGASGEGLDFATDERVTSGEALEVSVSAPDAGPCLAGALVHIVGTTRFDGHTVAHCQFERPVQRGWLAALASS
jgi:hypothetical protein